MKIDALISKMKHLGISLPSSGTGINGRILAADLETALGDHFFNIFYVQGTPRAEHCRLRRSVTPMKAYRYDKLKPTEQQGALDIDNNDWVAEEKFNGWRIVVTFVPGDGFRFWSGNISDVNFLPVDYTEHVNLRTQYGVRKNLAFSPTRFVMDTEAVCYDQVETLEGLLSTNTLDAVGAILGSHAERAISLQLEGATLQFMCFDALVPDGRDPSRLLLNQPLHLRRKNLSEILSNCNVNTFHLVEQKTKGKRQFLSSLWTKGAEGVVLKNLTKPYVSGGRVKTHAIKVKRSMSGEIGDNIDAFISGFINTPEHSKRNLIGGLRLSVFTKSGKEHHIATVTGIPDNVRLKLTELIGGAPILSPEFLGKVVVIDGQELSNRHRKLMHAKIDWTIGFRQDKIARDCVLDLTDLEEARY